MPDKIKININKLLDEVQNINASELKQVLDTANLIYSYLDIPVVIIDSKEIKSNLLITAMYLVGKEIGRGESDK